MHFHGNYRNTIALLFETQQPKVREYSCNIITSQTPAVILAYIYVMRNAHSIQTTSQKFKLKFSQSL